MRARLLFFAMGGAVLSAFACTERLPRENLPPSPPDAGLHAPGLDAPPVSTTCIAPARPTTTKAKISFARLGYPALDRPVEIARAGTRLYALEQGGVAKLLHEDGTTVTTFADLRSLVGDTGAGESGLLGIALHPRFAENGYVYLYYTVPFAPPKPANAAFQSVLARFESKDGGLTLDLSTEKRLLVVDQPYANHNGGTIAFGNDGFLYWGLGDGGSGGDPENRAQDKTSLFGKILRLDVDGGDPYAIPQTNPFASGGGREEIYALGFRNPYRFRFDSVSGDLWVGDVGQSAREEIDRVVLGGNYGWRIREGKTCFNPNPCDATGLIDPIVDHGRTEAISIIGGLVYRGSALPELRGHYVYADIGSGLFFSFAADAAAPVPQVLSEGLTKRSPTAFALDSAGEIVFTDLADGFVYRLGPPSPPPEMPPTFAATGCADPSGLFPYDVIVPQWQDGLEADRFLAIPPDAKLAVSDDGRMTMPPGSVALRTVRAAAKKVETQLLLVRPDGSTGAYAYRWSDDQTEATLAPEASAACVTCHTSEHFALGLEARQLDRAFTFAGGRSGNVLATLSATGMLARELDPGAIAPLDPLDSAATVERRARSYLHANCSYCHSGGQNEAIDLRITTPLAATNLCGTPRLDALVVSMRSTGADRMPPVGSTKPHAEAIAVVEDFVRATRCP